MRGCLDDLEAQTIASELEIVVVNSGSPEGEHEIVAEYMERYDNIVYVQTMETETVYGAWNRGIAASSGEYLTNANTDDRHRADAFEVLAGALDANPGVALAYAGYRITRVENEIFDTSRADEACMPKEYSRYWLRRGHCLPGPQPMWRRSAHEVVGLFDDSYQSAGDFDMWLRMAAHAPFLRVPEYLGLYLNSPTSVEHRNVGLSTREAQAALGRHAKLR